ncbi:MAG: DNA-directed RNA polymerase subunit alpha [Chloroflexi bacterium]|nr:DNA-directed RNA polymerase subunit alpha [Chloroflexota bacterium]
MIEMVKPKIEPEELTETYGRFVAEPLERGFGTTLGNTLRRVLLSSLPGAAVTQVWIESVEHEFSVVPHMKEDITDFLLNVKGLRLRSFSEHPGKLTLEVKGEGRVSAGDIKASSDYEIVNPELHLATLDSAEAKLVVEFTVERGRGYRPAVQSDGLPIGVIPVDAIFTPVRKVNYKLGATRIGQEASYERLTLEIWTDGTISPVEAVSQSARVLISQLSLFDDLAQMSQRSAEKQALRLSIPPERYNMPIEELELSLRTLNCLRRANITRVGELLEKSEEELLMLRNFGLKSMEEVKQLLQVHGFKYGHEATEAEVAGGAQTAPEIETAGELAESEPDEEMSQAETASQPAEEQEDET